jgi:glycosyltransferase involved in cell wall biosynthesis
MRLLILQDHLRMGGTERQTLQLATHATARGHAVTLLLFRPGGPLSARLEGAPFAVEVLQRWDTRVSLYAPGLARTLDRLRPEAILCMGRTANCYAGYLQERRPHLPVVGTIRTGKLLFPLHRWSLSAVRGVLVNTRWWQRRLREWGVPAERIHVVHNALLTGGLPRPSEEKRAALRQEAGLGEETVVLLQVAGFRRGKRQADLLRILAPLAHARDLPPWSLWFVGTGSERARCERLARDLGLGERVRFWGFRHDPHPFYGAADIAVSASAEDSLPNFLIEAQSTGLPLVASDYRGVREACLPGISGEIVPAGEGPAFRAALGDLVRDRARRATMGAAARIFAGERFSPARQADQVLDFITSLRRRP